MDWSNHKRGKTPFYYQINYNRMYLYACIQYVNLINYNSDGLIDISFLLYALLLLDFTQVGHDIWKWWHFAVHVTMHVRHFIESL